MVLTKERNDANEKKRVFTRLTIEKAYNEKAVR